MRPLCCEFGGVDVEKERAAGRVMGSKVFNRSYDVPEKALIQ